MKTYQEYLELKNKLLEKEEDRNKIGTKYIMSYSNLVPKYIDYVYGYIRDKDDNKKEICKSSIWHILDNKTIVEYLGNNKYKDLITEEVYDSSNSDDLLDCIDSPFCIRSEELLDDYNEFFIIDEEDKKDILFYYNMAKDELIKRSYNDLLESDSLSLEDIEIINNKLKCIDDEKIGNKYIIQYKDLSEVLKRDSSKNPLTYSWLESLKYTIIEYLGEGFYLDLITNMVFQDREVSIEFEKNNDRVDYTKYNEFMYNLAYKYPFRVTPYSRFRITDDYLINVYLNSYLDNDSLISALNRDIEDYHMLFNNYKNKMINNEYKRQYREALKEMETDFNERKRISDLEEAKKVFKLSK